MLGRWHGGELGNLVESEVGGQPDDTVLTLTPHLQAEDGGGGGLEVGPSLSGDPVAGGDNAGKLDSNIVSCNRE